MLQPSSQAGIEPVRLSQVESQFSNLQELRAQLSAVTQELERKLVSVISPVNAKSEPSPATPREVLVPLAETLREQNESINESITLLRQLTRSIELP